MILLTYGTRPEWIKIKPLTQELKRNGLLFKTLFTGQHENLVDSKADFNLTINNSGKNRLDNILSSLMNVDDVIFHDITHVLIQGDTTSALAISIASFHREIKIIHLEAGLRTYDFKNPFPEEMNRQMISRIADIHLCPTKLNYNNLIKEKCSGLKYVVGNTALDNLINTKTSYTNKVLVTIHRRENHEIIDVWFKEISKLALKNKELEFILPIHPNPNVQKHKHLLNGVNIIEPLGHENLIELLSNVKLIITDSGGLQEECSFLNKKIIVCRKKTERPESLKVHSFLCKNPKNLSKIFNTIHKNYEVNEECPYGDGNSSKKIVKILKNII